MDTLTKAADAIGDSGSHCSSRNEVAKRMIDDLVHDLQDLKEKLDHWDTDRRASPTTASEDEGGMLLRDGTRTGFRGRRDASHTHDQFEECSGPPSPCIHTIEYDDSLDPSTVDIILDGARSMDYDKESKCMGIVSVPNHSQIRQKNRWDRSAAPSPSPGASPAPSPKKRNNLASTPEGHSCRDWYVSSGINTDSEEEGQDLILKARMESDKEIRVAKRVKANGHTDSVGDICMDRRIISWTCS